MAKTRPRPVQKQTLFHPVLSGCFSYCFYKAAGRLRGYVDEAFATHKLVGPQFAILTILKHNGHLTQIELGRYLLTDRATMVKLLDGLEARKFIVRANDKHDRRVNRISISSRGLKTLARLNQDRLKIEKAFLTLIPKSQRPRLAQVMFQLASGTREKPTPSKVTPRARSSKRSALSS